MKRTRTALALTLFAAFAAPEIGYSQQGQWQPAVAAAPAAQAPHGTGDAPWRPAVYGTPPGLGAPSQFAGYSAVADHGGYVAEAPGACNSCGTHGCGCSGGDWLTDRFGVYGLWGSVEFMHAWAQGRSVPPLVTTGNNGVLPGATILFGNERIGEERQSAGRIVVGAWFDECENLGLGVRMFGLEGDNTGFDINSDANGNPVFGVPFFNVQNNAEDAVLASSPGEFAGGINVATSQDVLSGESYLRALLLRGSGYRVDLIGGYHYSQVSDGLDLTVDTTAIDPGGVFPVGTNIIVIDRFNTRNDFHGAVGGFQGELRHGCWRLHTLAKVSVGNMREQLTISGTSITDIPNGGRTEDNVGLFAQDSNRGTWERDETAYIPEANIGLGYQWNDCLELTVGYTFVYWSNVIMAGDQIDRSVDLSGAVARPEVNLRDTDFWVQGVTLGANWAY